MNKVLNAALEFAEKYKWSIIPLRPDKKPYIRWEQYQIKAATFDDIKQWWDKYPKAMIGVVTGKVSGLSVIDIDSDNGKKAVMDLLPDNFVAPTAITPRGGMHLYVKYCPKLRNATSVLPGVDIRSEGGYVAAPPSISYGKPYVWATLRSPAKIELPELPDTLLNAITKGEGVSNLNITVPQKDLFKHGRRDEDLFHVANCMIKGGLETGIAYEALHRISKTFDPKDPEYTEQEVATKIKSAIERAIRKDRNITQEVGEYIQTTTGTFSITDLCRVLQLSTLDDRKTISVILHRLVKDDTLERVGKYSGMFRLIERTCDELKINPNQPPPLKITWAFGLEKLVNIYPGNIIVIAGSQNAGKTAFILDFVKRNMENFPINYYSSEMGEEEFNLRLALFGDIKWKFKAYERTDNFADVIKPNEFNMLDYLEVTDEFWKVGTILRRIHEKLEKGIAVIALQKDPKKLLGRGSSFGQEKPRLYLSLDSNTLTITKAKNWANSVDNPNGKHIGFKLVQGSKFIISKTWKRSE